MTTQTPPPYTTELENVLREWMGVMMRGAMQDSVAFMKEHGFTMSQLGTLMRLAYNQRISVSEIAERMGITQASASHLAQQLVQADWVWRAEDASDRRVRWLMLTERGQQVMGRMMSRRAEWLQRVITRLSDDERARLIETLPALLAAARAEFGDENG